MSRPADQRACAWPRAPDVPGDIAPPTGALRCGGGGRFTIRLGERIGIYAQPTVGLMRADVGKNALGNLGFKDAESLDTYLSGRLGFEWYQLDRHLALGLTFGARLAQGFGITRVGTSDTPLIGDAAVSLRYAF